MTISGMKLPLLLAFASHPKGKRASRTALSASEVMWIGVAWLSLLQKAREA